MDRRGFLRGAFAAAAITSVGGIALLEQEIVASSKSIFLPPVDGWVVSKISTDNRLITVDWMSKEIMRILRNNIAVQERQLREIYSASSPQIS